MGETFEYRDDAGPLDVSDVVGFRWDREGHEAGVLRVTLRDRPRPEVYSIRLTGQEAARAMAALVTLFRD